MRDFLRIMECLRTLNQLINQGKTGPVHELAVRLGIAPTTVHKYLNHLRKLARADGVTITYSTALRSYVYTKDGIFVFTWGFQKV